MLIADFWTDPTHTQPLPAALMAGEFAEWLAATGWRLIGHAPLAGADLCGHG